MDWNTSSLVLIKRKKSLGLLGLFYIKLKYVRNVNSHTAPLRHPPQSPSNHKSTKSRFQAIFRCKTSQKKQEHITDFHEKIKTQNIQLSPSLIEFVAYSDYCHEGWHFLKSCIPHICLHVIESHWVTQRLHRKYFYKTTKTMYFIHLSSRHTKDVGFGSG